jgi:hypothetical protein
MKFYHEMQSALLAGAVSGALILGIAGRAGMAGVALVTGNSLNLSVRGLLEVIIVGILLGVIGGVLILALRRVCRENSFTLGLLVGMILFISSSFLGLANGRITFHSSFISFFTLGVVAIIFCIYGVCAATLFSRFNHYMRKYQ